MTPDERFLLIEMARIMRANLSHMPDADTRLDDLRRLKDALMAVVTEPDEVKE